MVTPRNVIALVIALAVFSITWEVFSLLQPPDSGGMRGDSYGTRFHGHRAIYETFNELGIQTDRRLQPPVPRDLENSVLVFWKPHAQLIVSEPSWLEDIATGVRAGGHVVVGHDGSSLFPDMVAEKMKESAMIANPDRSALELLGVDQVTVTPDDDVPGLPTSETDVAELIAGSLTGGRAKVPRLNYTIRGTGVFESATETIESIELPTGKLHVIDMGDQPVQSAMYAIDPSGTEHCIAARIPIGAGTVTVASTPWILSNAGIGQADNVLLAAMLLLEDDHAIVFDEFYHGLAVRGNPMWLFSQRTYGTVMLALLALTGVVVWRSAVFLGPPLSAVSTSRRSIREYIDAMARFMCEGRHRDQWILGEVRDGVLWNLRQEHGLPPEQHNVEELLVIMSRRDPQRADALRGSLNDVDSVIHNSDPPGRIAVIQLLQRMTACLSRNATGRFKKKSTK